MSRKLTDIPLKLKLNGKRLYHANSGKHLGINIDENLNWKQPVSDIDIKLNKENGILSKLRHFINMKTLKSIYHAIFDSHLYYSSLLGRKTQIQLRDYFFIKEILIYIYIYIYMYIIYICELAIAISFISAKGVDEERVMLSRSNNKKFSLIIIQIKLLINSLSHFIQDIKEV